MELTINEGILNQYRAIKEREILEMDRTNFHFHRIKEIRFRITKRWVTIQLNQINKNLSN